jgi:UDP-N-acetylmuramoylalanine-D-glutamate ligase
VKTLVYGLGESGVAATSALVERGGEVRAADAKDGERLRDTLADLGSRACLRRTPKSSTA